MDYKQTVLAMNPALFVPMEDTTTMLGQYANTVTIGDNNVLQNNDYWTFNGSRNMSINGLPTRSVWSDMTWSVWVRTTGSALVIPWRRAASSTTTTRDPRLQIGGSDAQTTMAAYGGVIPSIRRPRQIVNDGEWHYVTLVSKLSQSGKSAQVLAYVDGIPYGVTSAAPNTNSDIAGALMIGFIGSGPTSPYNYQGDMQGLEYYERCLTEEEINTLYQAKKNQLSVDGTPVKADVLTPSTPVVATTLPDYPDRYYDIADLMAMQNPIGSTSHNNFKAAYNLTLNVPSSAATIGSYSYDPATTAQAVEGMKQTYDYFSRWPVSSLPIPVTVNLVGEIRQNGTVLGGWTNLNSTVMYINTNYPIDGPSGGFLAGSGQTFVIVAHEMGHVFQNAELTKPYWEANKSRWAAANVVPYGSPVGTERTEGYVRDYGLTAGRIEDSADILMVMTNPSLRETVANWMATEPSFAAKMQIWLDILGPPTMGVINQHTFRGVRGE